MRIAIAADHAGYPLKEVVRRDLVARGHTVLDLGTDNPDVPVDYPDFAEAAGRRCSTAGPTAAWSCAAPASGRVWRPTRFAASGPGCATTTTRPTRGSSTTT